MRRARGLSILLISLCIENVWGADQSTSLGNGFSIKPELLDSTDGSGATLALAFNAAGTPWKKKVTGNDSDIIGEATTGKVELSYQAAGTVAADAARNTKDFLDALLSGNYAFGGTFGSLTGGPFGKFETDQRFDKKQFVYGARATYAKLGLLQISDWVALDVNYGRVDPKGDKDREAALGTDDLRQYYRTDLEFDYHYPVRWKLADEFTVESLEVQYLYFLEHAPPPQIEAAGLNRHHLFTGRVNLANHFYLAYSTGSLPFDKNQNKTYEFGFRFKLQ
jgi:hypothetical protein